MCLYPKQMLNRKYLPNKKNNFNPPKLTDERFRYVYVDCGKCIECMKRKSNDWRVRLLEEIKINDNSKFVTFTFTDEAINKLSRDIIESGEFYRDSNHIAKLAIRRFLERHRKLTGKSVRHWLITELGGKYGRLHLHGILFTNKTKQEIESIWQYGMIWYGQFVNEKTINYIVKYLHKPSDEYEEFKPIILASPGIGSNYINSINIKQNEYVPNETNLTYKCRKGLISSLPKYYKNLIYTDEEKELIWGDNMNKGKLYIMGEEVNANNELEFKQLTEYYRHINDNMGYGNDKQTLEDELYKNKIKNIKYKNKIKNMKNKNI